MNAHSHPDTLTPEALAIAATNGAVLRALLRDGPIAGDAAVAKAAGVAQKNVGRTLKTLLDKGLVERLNGQPAGWEITRAGRTAILAIDVAQGRADPALASSAPDPDADPDALLLTHAQLRPNPLQPRRLNLGDPDATGADADEDGDDDRRTPDRKALDELKASIVAAGGLLQNLVVFPADADGVHMISAGERRWRAIGELIAEGMWPADRRLRALQRDATPGQVSFLALVENGQHEPLKELEQARAYAELTRETGWSARHAAHQTGKSPRLVQERLQVLDQAAPEDVARHEADPRAFTWEDLRKTVRKPGAAPTPEVRQIDVEDVGRPFELDARDRELLAYKADYCRKLKPAGRLMLVELADRFLHAADEDRRGRDVRVAHEHPGTDSGFILAGAGFSWSPENRGGWACIAAASLEWLRLQGLLPYGENRAPALRRARQEAGAAADRIARAEASGTYLTPWLDPEWTPPARPSNFGEALEQFTEHRAAGQPLDPDSLGPAEDVAEKEGATEGGTSATSLIALQRLALAELARKLTVAGEHGGWARVRLYWLDATFLALKDLGLIEVTHKLENGPHAKLTDAAIRGAAANLLDLGHSGLAILRHEARARLNGADYCTPWLNETPADAATDAGLPQVSPSNIVNALGDDEDDEAEDGAPTHDDLDVQEDLTARLLLEDVRATLARTHTAAEIRELLGRAFLRRPFAAGVQADTAGVIFDGDNDEVAVVDHDRQSPDDFARAIAELVAYGLNLASGSRDDTQPRTPIDGLAVDRLAQAADAIQQLLLREIDPTTPLFAKVEDLYASFSSALNATRTEIEASKAAPLAAEPLFALHAGDLVSIGGEASAYRLIETVREGGYGGTTFRAQQVRLPTYKDHGQPRTVTLHAIQRVVRQAEG
ncbi:ParB/Srx family N-terminal domain-containing protein [Phenylobacterium sp.]|uniref:ParB/RepB/Spo0J family partition protein n=1 Tax=Phenylobacterium sp. TaxID=1871053 RepID=UPI00301E1485